jgi:putative addiction module component (TIGR02574 family)
MGVEKNPMSNIDDLFNSACQLPEQSRVELIVRLQGTVHEDGSVPFSPDEIDEFRRRVAEYDADPSVGVPWETVRQRAFDRLKRAQD